MLSQVRCVPSLCNLMDSSLPGFSVLGIFQARILEWVAISYSRGSSWLRKTRISCVSCLGKRILYHCPTRAYTILLAVSENLSFLGTSCIQKHTVCVLLCLVHFTCLNVCRCSWTWFLSQNEGEGVFTVCGSLCPTVEIDCVSDSPSHLQKAVD